MTVTEERTKRVVTDTTKQRMKQSARKRKKHTRATKIKIGAKLLGKKRTSEQIEHYRLAKSGENSPTAKLTSEEVTEIKRLLKTGEVTYKQLQVQFELDSWQNIRWIDLGANWKILLTDEEKAAIEDHGKISPGLSPARKKLEKEKAK